MSEWVSRSLTGVADAVGGSSFPKAAQGRATGDVPFIKVSDMNAAANQRNMTGAANWVTDDERAALRAKAWPVGTVVFPKVGAALKTEKRRILGIPACFDNNVMGLVAGPEVDAGYLLAFMETVRLGELAQEGVVPSINRRLLATIQMPLPSLHEQRRIANLCDTLHGAAEAARTALEASRDLLAAMREELIAAASVREVELAGLIESIQAGRSPQAEDRLPASGERAVLKVSAVQPARFVATEVKALPTETTMPRAASLRAGDLLMTRANTRQLVGAVCQVPRDLPHLFLSDKTLRVTPTAGLDPAYAVHALATKACRRQIESAATGTSGSMKNISQAKIGKLVVQVPASRAEQRRVAATLDAIVTTTRQAEAHVASLHATFDAIRRALLSGEQEIPESYDRFLREAA